MAWKPIQTSFPVSQTIGAAGSNWLTSQREAGWSQEAQGPQVYEGQRQGISPANQCWPGVLEVRNRDLSKLWRPTSGTTWLVSGRSCSFWCRCGGLCFDWPILEGSSSFVLRTFGTVCGRRPSCSVDVLASHLWKGSPGLCHELRTIVTWWISYPDWSSACSTCSSTTSMWSQNDPHMRGEGYGVPWPDPGAMEWCCLAPTAACFCPGSASSEMYWLWVLWLWKLAPHFGLSDGLTGAWTVGQTVASLGFSSLPSWSSWPFYSSLEAAWAFANAGPILLRTWRGLTRAQIPGWQATLSGLSSHLVA